MQPLSAFFMKTNIADPIAVLIDEGWSMKTDTETLAMEKTAHQHGGTVTTAREEYALIQPPIAFQIQFPFDIGGSPLRSFIGS